MKLARARNISNKMDKMNTETTRVALITGAAGGIGRATVRRFADAGWRVIGVDRAPFDGPPGAPRPEPFPKDGFFIQSDISDGKNLEYIFYRNKSHLVPEVLRNFFQIFFVLGRDDDLVYIRSKCCKGFLPKTTDRQNPSTQGNLPSHGNILLDLLA